MKGKTVTLMSLALVALLALPAAAEKDYRTGRQYGAETDRLGSIATDLVPCHMLMGEDINTPSGDQLGNVDALVLHPNGQQVAYAIVSKGAGFLGLGGKNKVAVPWTALTWYRDGEHDFDAVLNASGAQIENALEMDQTTGYIGNERFIRDVYAAFGSQYREEYDQVFGSKATSSGRLPLEKLEVAKLIGTEVMGSNQNELGTIDDVACDSQSGRIMYAIIGVSEDLKSSFNLPQNHIAVPWASLQPSRDEIRLDIRASDLPDLAVDYGNEDIQELEDQSFATNVHQVAGVQPYWIEQQTTQGRVFGDRDQMQTRRDTWQQDQQTWRQEQQMGRDTHDLDDRQMSYRGLAQGQPVTIEGTVDRIYTHTAGGTDELVLHVMTNDGRSVFVQAGPAWFAKQKNVDFRMGDRVSVTGHLVSNPGQSESLVARTIETQDQTFTIRDRQLRPEWARR